MNQPHLITPEKLAGMDRFYRMNLINSLSGYKQPFLVGTIDGRNRTNLGLFNSLVHIGAQPARLGFFIRPLTVPRHTYHNIIERKKFTINLVPEAFIDPSHQASADYPWGVSEFEKTGLTPYFSASHIAPYVEEATIRIGLELEEEQKLACNGNILIVGKVVEIYVPENGIFPNGSIDIIGQKTAGVIGLDTYFTTEFKKILPYARPN
jgi:flavin reductase (DIM6/NTAB) family NADH-FMN oxidoreductase RutF